MGKNQFYIYLKSDADTGGAYPQNKGGDFTVPLFSPRYLSKEEWEVGVSSISFPDTFYNIYGDMCHMSFENQLCELHFKIPPGRYTPETFVATLNFVSEAFEMYFKIENVKEIHEVKLQVGKSVKHLQKVNVGLLPSSAKDWEAISGRKLKKNPSTLFEERRPYPISQLPPNVLQAMRAASDKFVQAIKEEKEIYFTLLRPNVLNPQVKKYNTKYIDIATPSLLEWVYYARGEYDDDPSLKFLQFYKKFRLMFFYNKFTNKIGVKPFYKRNPFFDYCYIYDERLKEMLGMSEKDRKIISLTDHYHTPHRDPYLNRKPFRMFDYEQNFNRYCGNVFVYSDIVQESFLGNVKANLLEILTIPARDLTKTSNRLVFPFSKPHYKAIDQNVIQNISIKLCDELGQELHFNDNGKTLVDLHFRKYKREQEEEMEKLLLRQKQQQS